MNNSRSSRIFSTAYRILLNIRYGKRITPKIGLTRIDYKPLGFNAIFVSSNVDNAMSFNQIMQRIKFELNQSSILVAYSDAAAMALKTKAVVRRSIGVWDDGNEEGVVIFLSRFCDQTLGDCLGSMIGKTFHQKVVMTYHDEPGGNDVIYRLSFENGYSVSQINKILDNAGIVNKTILLSPEFKHEAIILEEERNLHDTLIELRNQHRFKIVYSKGTIQYLGHYDQEGVLTDIEARKKSGDVFNQIISTYFDSIEDVNVPESPGQYAAL